MARRDPFTIGLVIVVYVLPVALVTLLLVSAGLPLVALALLGAEAVVAVAVVVAKRPVNPDRRPAPRWAVPAAFVAVMLGLVGVALLAARAG